MKVKAKPQERSIPDRADQSGILRRHESGTIEKSRARKAQAPLALQLKVLVVGIVPSLTWSVARALMLAGHKPVVLGSHRASPLRMLPGIQYLPWQNVRWFDADLDPLLVDQIEDACREHEIDSVIPVDYPSCTLLSDYGYGVRSASVAALPHSDLMRMLHDKWQLSNILTRLGMPQPQTKLAASASSLAAIDWEFPIVTKALTKSGAGSCQMHHSREQLEERIVQAGLTADYPLLVQEYIPGQDVGFAFLARHGQLIAYAAFEQPTRGSRRYFDVPRLRHYVATLVRETGYHGVGEIDTRYNPESDEYRMLAVNPRFWESTLYAAHAGMNFPELLARLDSLPASVGFTGQMVPVRLSMYEQAASRSVLMAEELYNSMVRGHDS